MGLFCLDWVAVPPTQVLGVQPNGLEGQVSGEGMAGETRSERLNVVNGGQPFTSKAGKSLQTQLRRQVNSIAGLAAPCLSLSATSPTLLQQLHTGASSPPAGCASLLFSHSAQMHSPRARPLHFARLCMGPPAGHMRLCLMLIRWCVLPAHCSLNVNAWANYAPTEDVQQLQRVQTLEGLALATAESPLHHLRSLGEEGRGVAGQTCGRLALQPSGQSRRPAGCPAARAVTCSSSRLACARAARAITCPCSGLARAHVLALVDSAQTCVCVFGTAGAVHPQEGLHPAARWLLQPRCSARAQPPCLRPAYMPRLRRHQAGQRARRALPGAPAGAAGADHGIRPLRPHRCRAVPILAACPPPGGPPGRPRRGSVAGGDLCEGMGHACSLRC